MNDDIIYIPATESEVLHAYAKSLIPEGQELKGYQCFFSKKDVGLLGKRILFRIKTTPVSKT